jgi:signal transduction histidine kinase
VIGVVRSQHGAIQIDSTPKQGTTFRILFPTASPKD